MYPHRSVTVLTGLAVLAWGEAGAEPEGYHVRYAMPPTPSLSCGVDSLYVCARASGADALAGDPGRQFAVRPRRRFRGSS